MFTPSRWLPYALAVVAATGCAATQLRPGAVRDVRKLAVVVRVSGGPTVEAARKDPREGRAFPTLAPDEADLRLQEVLARQVTLFELEQRIREAILARLPAEPPWSTAMSAAEVATAQQSLLVVDRSTPVDYEALHAAGADAVLEMRVTSWGVARNLRTGLHLRGDGRLLRLPGRSAVWADRLDTDLSTEPEGEGVDVVALKDGGFREAVIALVGRLAGRIAGQLGGER